MPAPPLGDLAVHVQGGRGRRAPGELAGPAQADVAQPVPVRACRLDDGPGDRRRILRVGQHRRLPAVSGMALVSEVTTGQPQAMASRIGSPKVSLSDGYTKTSAAR